MIVLYLTMLTDALAGGSDGQFSSTLLGGGSRNGGQVVFGKIPRTLEVGKGAVDIQEKKGEMLQVKPKTTAKQGMIRRQPAKTKSGEKGHSKKRVAKQPRNQVASIEQMNQDQMLTYKDFQRVFLRIWAVAFIIISYFFY